MSDMKKVGSRAEVFHGTAEETVGGLEKSNLKKKDGRIISKKQAKLNPGAKLWMKAVAQARKETKSKGMVLLKQGEPLYESAKKIHDKLKKKASKKK